MWRFPFRGLGALLVIVLGLAAAGAQDPPGADDAAHALWQAAVTGQIEAFRTGDDALALFFAGAAFKRALPNPQRFVRVIRRSGYGPIIDSVSHSFGAFEVVSADEVMQLVRIIGPDHRIYDALYRLGREAGGWKVHGVTLRDQAALAI